MEPRRTPWPAEEVGVCVYGRHGAMRRVAETLREQGIAVRCLATQVPGDAPADPVEEALARAGLFEDPYRTGEALGLATLHLPRPHDAASAGQLRAAGVDVVLSLSAPILKPPFLDAFDGWTFNFHGSRTYRGRAGLSWNILHGLDRDAVVLHWIDRGVDTGAWIDEDGYGWDDTALPIDLMRAQRPCFERLTVRFAELLRGREIPRRPPPERPYLPALSTDRDGWVDWHWSAGQIERAARAFATPYGGASARLGRPGGTAEVPVRLGRCSVEASRGGGRHPLTVGAILGATPGGGVTVACGDGRLAVHTLTTGGEERPAAEVARVSMRFRGRP